VKCGQATKKQKRFERKNVIKREMQKDEKQFTSLTKGKIDKFVEFIPPSSPVKRLQK
jgi:hypothetical protein